MATHQTNNHRRLAQQQWQQQLNDASSVTSSSASPSFGIIPDQTSSADDGLRSSVNASQPTISHSASRKARPNLQAGEGSKTRPVSDSNNSESEQTNSTTNGLETHTMPISTNENQDQPVALETSSITQELKDHVTTLFDTQLKPTVERVNELGRTQNEMIRLQREMMGVMLSLILRMDSASPMSLTSEVNANGDNAPVKNGASIGSGKGTEREIDETLDTRQDAQAYTKELLKATVTDVALLMKSVAGLSNRIDNLGEDVGLLVGSVLGISGSSNNSSRNYAEHTTTGVNNAAEDGLQERPGKRRRVTFDDAGAQTDKKCVLDRLGNIETDIQELLKKTKDSEPRKSDNPAWNGKHICIHLLNHLSRSWHCGCHSMFTMFAFCF